MLRNVVRLIVFGLVVHAAVRIVPEFWHYLKFRDACAEAATYAGRKPLEELRARIAMLAREHDIPVTEQDIAVTRQGEIIYVSTAWTAQLEYVPTRYYPYDFVVDVEGRRDRMAGLAP
jgi:hypothetical protein